MSSDLTMQQIEQEFDKLIEERAKKYRNRWISCSEKMPKNGKDVLVWFEYFRYGSYNSPFQTYGISYAHNGSWSGLVNGTTGWKNLKIIAWMPLPEPYKGEK